MSAVVAGTASFGDRFAVVHDVSGPRVRLGVLWTLLVGAAFFVGTGALAVAFALTAGVGTTQVVARWRPANRIVAQLTAGVGAMAIVAAATVGLRLVGLALMAVAAAVVLLPALLVMPPGPGSPEAPARPEGARPAATELLAAAGPVLGPALFSGLAGAAAVQVDRRDAVAFLFLIGAVSTYDAGDFLCGAGYASRIVGPGAGVIGVLAVTGAMYLAEPPPFEGTETIVAGLVLAVGCPLGQLLGSWLLPDPSARAPGLRRLDSWLVAAPAFLVAVWSVGG